MTLDSLGLPGGSDGKVFVQFRRSRFNPWVGKISWRRKWQPTPVFFPGKSHAGRNLVGYSPWGRKESDTTERLHFHLDSWAILPLLNNWDLFYIKILYKFSSNVRIKRIEIFASECLSYLCLSWLMSILECVCSNKNKQNKWSLSPIWAFDFLFSLEWKLLLFQ